MAAALAIFPGQEVTCKFGQQRPTGKKSLGTKGKAIGEKSEDLYEKSKHSRRYPPRSCAALLALPSSTQLKTNAVLGKVRGWGWWDVGSRMVLPWAPAELRYQQEKVWRGGASQSKLILMFLQFASALLLSHN